MLKSILGICCGASALITAGAQAAEFKAHGLFRDNAVLQQGQKVPVWGTTDQPAQVTVQFAGQQLETEPKDGNWQVELAPLKANAEPATLTVTQGDKKLEFKNILVGDVWLCGGQSNMEWPVKNSDEAEEGIATANNDKIRLFTVPRIGREDIVSTDVAGDWLVTSPQTVPDFSGVGYYFGRALQPTIGIPVGLISANSGGTPAERWMSKEALTEAIATTPELKDMKPVLWQYIHWNSMLAPIVKFPIKGAIWYQGESNADRAWLYRYVLPAMIKSWREAWGVGDFPFLMVQLAPYGQVPKEPEKASTWAEVRDAQLDVSKKVPNTALVVITDLGDERDIHPKRKRGVGERLASTARGFVYGQPVPYQGPTFDTMVFSKSKAFVAFGYVGNGLVVKGDELTGFTIAGEDKVFHNAQAKLEGSAVVVWSDEVPKPIAVRYGWSSAPHNANLWNDHGLPTSPFRTDDFPVSTQDIK